MNFVYPAFLWALALIAIPVIIHLFNFRKYKTVYFSRVKFLKEVTEDSRSGLKLKHLLVLIARILAITFLVFAFAKPFIPAGNQKFAENASLIYLDNSYSMQAIGMDGDLLNESKNKIIELLKSMDKTERVALITADLKEDQFRFYTPGDIIEKIKMVDFSARTTKLSTVINAQIDLVKDLAENSNIRFFIFSDFQKSTADFEFLNAFNHSLYFYQPQKQISENIYIDSVWFETPVHRANAPIDVFYRIQNKSNVVQQDIRVALILDDKQEIPKRITVDANSFYVGSINFSDKTAGIKKGTIEVETNQLFFDDAFHFSYEIKKQINILLVRNNATDNRNIEQLFGLDDYYQCQSITLDKISQEAFKDRELIIIQNANDLTSGVQDLLSESLKNGATVVLIPGDNINASNWNNFLAKENLPTLNRSNKSGELSYFNSEDPLYNGVFASTPTNFKFPTVQTSYNLNIASNSNFITLFGFNKVQPYLYYAYRGNGRIIFMSSSLDLKATDFQNHALFAASFLRFAETASFTKPLFYTIGNMQNYPLKNTIDEKNQVHFMSKELSVDFIPLVTQTNNSRNLSFAQIQDELKEAGFYELNNNFNFSDYLALNYNRLESLIDSYDPNSILQYFKEAGIINVTSLNNDETGVLNLNAVKSTDLWRLCLILALIFLAVEILLLKFWKT